MKIIDDLQFLKCLEGLKLDTGYDLESVGLSAEVDNFAISIDAHRSTNYQLELVDFHYQDDAGKWQQAKPTLYQYVELKKALNREVTLLHGTAEERAREAAAAKKEAGEERRYGIPGAIYSKIYALAFLFLALSFNACESESKPVEIQDVVNKGMAELNLDAKVIVRPLSEYHIKEARKRDTDLKAQVRKVAGGYIIEVNDLPAFEVNEVIAHELIHIQQYERGQLRLLPSPLFVVWNGRTYSLLNTPYKYRPWEIDAFNRSPALARKL